jgi:HEAT repeat protein
MTNTKPIIDLLRSFTIRHDPWRVEDALDALTVVPDGHVIGLIQALSDPDDEIRLLAVEILYSMGDMAEAALPALIDTLNDPDRIVRVAAVAPILGFGRKALAAIPVLETWLCCGDEFSEVTAAAAIIRIDAALVDDVLPVLIDALESDDYGVRCNAVWHLGQLGSVTRRAVPALKRLLDDESISHLVGEAIASITGELL